MMSKTKKYVTAVTTFSVALGIGFVMQYGDAVASRFGVGDAPVFNGNELAVQAPRPQSRPDAMSLPQTAMIFPASVTNVPSEEDSPLFNLISPDSTFTTGTQACTITMSATPAPMAMVSLAVDSPCRPDALAAVHHKGMMFNALTDAKGQLRVDVPALDAEAFFIVAFDDGKGAVAITGVPDFAMYDRAVLQWQGHDDVQLHALEFGAGYEDAGHIWAEAIADQTNALAGQGGFLTRLGNDALPNPLMAEVYTYPSGMNARDGSVVLSVEAEITARNCGREVAAQSMQVGPGQELSAIDLTMTMPGCDAVGDYLLLDNMFNDLRLASN